MRNILEVEWAGLDEVYTVADLGLHGQEGENEREMEVSLWYLVCMILGGGVPMASILWPAGLSLRAWFKDSNKGL